jgi:hypothetical protein
MQSANKNRMLVFMFLFIMISASSAFAIDLSLSGGLETLGRTMGDMVNDRWITFGIMFILTFMLMYAIFSMGLNKIPIFKGSDAAPNKQGKIAGVALSLMSAYGLVHYAGSPLRYSEKVLEFMGFWGAMAFGFLMFAISFYNIRNGEWTWGKALFTTGIGLLCYGMFFGSKAVEQIGELLMIIGFIWMIVGSLGKGKKAEGSGDGDSSTNNKTNNNSSSDSDNDDDNDEKRQGRPRRVKNLKAILAPDGDIKIDWDANPSADNIIGYKVRRRPTDRSFIFTKGSRLPFQWDFETQIDGGATSYLDTTPDITRPSYTYEVCAINDKGRGRWNSCEVQRGMLPVFGKVSYYDSFQEYGLNNINVTIVSPTGKKYEAITGDNGLPDGQFKTSVPRMSGLYTVVISDSKNVYQSMRLVNQINTNDANAAQYDLGEPIQGRAIPLFPIPGRTCSVSLPISKSNSRPVAGELVSVLIPTPFANIPFNGLTDSQGQVTVPNVPAGYVARPVIASLDPATSLTHEITEGKKGILMRTTGRVTHDRVYLSPKSTVPTITVTGTAYGITYAKGSTPSPLPQVTVRLKSYSGTGNRVTGYPTSSNGQYTISSVIPMHTYGFQPTHVPGTFRYNGPKNYIPPNNGTDTKNFTMVPRRPFPQGIISKTDNSGNKIIIRTV